MGIEQNRLKQYRKSNGWTQKFMAEQLGISQQRYQQWETADEDMRTSTLRKICETFKVSANWLLGLDEEIGETVNFVKAKGLEDDAFIQEQLQKLNKE